MKMFNDNLVVVSLIGLTLITVMTLTVGCGSVQEEQIPLETTETVRPTPTVTPIPTFTPTPTPTPKSISAIEPINYSEGQTYYITNFCACTYCCGPNAQGICADGTPVSDLPFDHSAAADPSIPFGTRFIIPELTGYEVYTVHDRGSGVHGAHMDLFQEDHSSASNAPCGYYTIYFIE